MSVSTEYKIIVLSKQLPQRFNNATWLQLKIWVYSMANAEEYKQVFFFFFANGHRELSLI